LKRDAVWIQSGIVVRLIRIVERNISGSPMKLATPIIDSSRRISSASPCEKPPNAHASSAAARKTTSHPSGPPWTRTPSARPTTRITSAWIIAVIPARTIWESTIDTRLTGVVRKRLITWRLRSSIIAIPLHVAPKNAFITITPGARNSTYEPAPARRVGTFENSWP
jgi:hypothetical protein